ncbi:MAG TPA: thioredoxin domain-containing protein [Chloroflexota bacterium]
MSDRRQPGARRQPSQGRMGWWPLVAIAGLAVLVVGGLVWVSQAEPGPSGVAVPSTGNVKGDPSAPVVVEEWGDFQCPACRQYALGPGRQLDETFVAEGTVRVVWRHMAFLGPESLWAAEASECAAEQGQFWAYHDKLFAEQSGENRGTFSKENLKRFASELGLDRQRFDACLDGGRYTRKVQAEIEAGERKGVRATPTMFVNGRKIEGLVPFDQLRRVVEQALEEAGAAKGSGG